MSSKKEKVIELFNERYNCAQAIFSVYSSEFGVDKENAMRLTAGFGGGIAGLGKTCGAVNAALMIIGLKYGNSNKMETEKKIKTKETVRNFMNDFESRHAKIECKSLLEEEPEKKYAMHSEKCISILEEVCNSLDKYL